KNGTGTWNLTGTSSYTGVTTVNAGILAVTTLANAGTNSSIGAANNGAGDIVLNGGTLQYTGGSVSIDRLFSVGTTAGSTLDAGAGGGIVTFNNTGNLGFNG